MKVLLINPPQTAYSDSTFVWAGLPLGLMYIAAILDGAGHDVEILDTLLHNCPPTPQGEAIQWGMPWEKIRAEVMQKKPDLVGIGNPYTVQLQNAVNMARLVKEVNPKIPVIVGGPHVTVQAEEFLETTPSADIVVRGEGEYTMLELCRYYEAGESLDGIKGITYRKDGEVRVNPPRGFITNLDDLPYPAYHLVDMEHYLNPQGVRYRATRFRREVPLITSRGCPFNCVFCCIHLHMGRRWRAHSAPYVINHIKHLLTKHKVEHIHFEDDNLTLNSSRFDEIINGVLAQKLKFLWDTPNGVRAEGLTMERLQKMKEVGCVHLWVGVESGDQWVLDNIIGKKLSLQDVLLVAQRCKQLGVKLSAFYVIGFPGETKENMERTVEFALRMRRQYGVSMDLFVATPSVGTQLYEICRSKGYLTREPTPEAIVENRQYGKSLIRTPEFTPEEVGALATKAFRRYARFFLWDSLRDWRVNIRLALREPGRTVRHLRRWVGL